MHRRSSQLKGCISTCKCGTTHCLFLPIFLRSKTLLLVHHSGYCRLLFDLEAELAQEAFLLIAIVVMVEFKLVCLHRVEAHVPILVRISVVYCLSLQVFDRDDPLISFNLIITAEEELPSALFFQLVLDLVFPHGYA